MSLFSFVQKYYPEIFERFINEDIPEETADKENTEEGKK